MANNSPVTEKPAFNFVNRTTTSVVEPMVLHYQQNRRYSTGTNTIFAISLFVLLILLLSYIVFHEHITDTKLNRLTTNVDSNANDIKQLYVEISQTLKSIELLLIAQTKKSNIDIMLNGQDLHEFHSNQTVLYDFLQKVKEHL